MPRKRCAFYTLGCKVNQYDTEGLMKLFGERGYDTVDFDSAADVYCINTCTVTQVADKKSRQAVRRARRLNPKAVVAVVGCYAQVAPEEVAAIPGVDVVCGTEGRGALVDLVEQAMRREGPILHVRRGRPSGCFEELPSSHFAGRHRGFVKVQDGCDEYCAYCRVPFARGASRSRAPESVLREVEALVESGHLEVVLTGIHLGAYGKDLAVTRKGSTPDLAWLLERCAEVDGIGRIRLSSVEPMDVDERLIEAVAGLPKVARHFHIPLQSGDDAVLAMMNRKYSTLDYERIAERIREAISPVAITTDIMVGFPGETREMFLNSRKFARRMGFSRMHVFKYSKRPGTPAALMSGQVDSATKRIRSEKMIGLGLELACRFCRSLVGMQEEALVEDHDPERAMAFGLGSTYVRMELPGSESLVGRLVRVNVVGAEGDLIHAERLSSDEEGFEDLGEK